MAAETLRWRESDSVWAWCVLHTVQTVPIGNTLAVRSNLFLQHPLQFPESLYESQTLTGSVFKKKAFLQQEMMSSHCFVEHDCTNVFVSVFVSFWKILMPSKYSLIAIKTKHVLVFWEKKWSSPGDKVKLFLIVFHFRPVHEDSGNSFRLWASVVKTAL